MACSVFQRTIPEWEAELARVREHRAAPPSAEQIVRNRNWFGEISVTMRRFRQDQRLERPEYAALQHLYRDGLLLTRAAYQELEHYTRVDSATVSLETLQELLGDLQSRLLIIETQLTLVDSSLHLAEMLRPVVEDLLHQDAFPAHRLGPLLQRLESRRTHRPAIELVPWPGLSLERILEQSGWPLPWFYASAISSARWIAAVQEAFTDNVAYPVSNLIAAALLADLGLLIMASHPPGLRLGTSLRSSAAARRHPEISAAVLAGLSGASPEWALLAGIHHERLDGSGYPRRLSGSQFTLAATGFTAALRWSELIQRTSTALTAEETLAISVQALWKETQRGAYDARIVLRLVEAVHPGWATALRSHEDFAGIPLLDPAHGLTGPHQVQSMNASELQRAAQTVGPPSPHYLRQQYRQAHHSAPQHQDALSRAASGT